MATIKLSEYSRENVVVRMLSAMGGSNPRIYLMKGTQPNQAEIAAAGANFRSSDALVYFSTYNEWTTTGTTPVSTFRLPYLEATAVASGTATWFYHTPYYNSSNAEARFCGSVTVTGGGGDLEMSSVDIVNGELYGVGPVDITVLQEYTY